MSDEVYKPEFADKQENNRHPILITLTPEMADEFLNKHFKNQEEAETFLNRAVCWRIVDDYCKKMLNKEWTLLYDPIIITHKGDIINGLKRTISVCISRVTIEIYLVDGLSEERANEIKNELDRLKPRTKEDSLIEKHPEFGVENIKRAVSVVRAMYGAYDPKWSNMTEDELNRALTRHNEELFFVLKLGSGTKQTHSSVLSAAARAYPYENKDKLKRFLYLVNPSNGRGCVSSQFDINDPLTKPIDGLTESAVLRFKEWFEENAKSKGGRDTTNGMVSKCCQAIKKFCQDSPVYRWVNEKKSVTKEKDPSNPNKFYPIKNPISKENKESVEEIETENTNLGNFDGKKLVENMISKIKQFQKRDYKKSMKISDSLQEKTIPVVEKSSESSVQVKAFWPMHED